MKLLSVHCTLQKISGFFKIRTSFSLILVFIFHTFLRVFIYIFLELYVFLIRSLTYFIACLCCRNPVVNFQKCCGLQYTNLLENEDIYAIVIQIKFSLLIAHLYNFLSLLQSTLENKKLNFLMQDKLIFFHGLKFRVQIFLCKDMHYFQPE